MTENDSGWEPDFPPVMQFVDLEYFHDKPWKLLQEHPGYDDAKNHEDRTAALSLVHSFLNTPENLAQLKMLRDKYPDAIVVPLRAMEARGNNRIPSALAEYIIRKTGLELDTSIVQTNRVHRTGKDEWHRFAFRPKFGGDVKAGRKYIIVDDVFSLGGSFSELRRFIQSNGGRVVQAAAMAAGRSGNEIAPRPDTLKNLVDKYGSDTLSLFLKEVKLYDGSIKALTEPEARALRRAPSLDEARDRILAARRQGRSQMGSRSPQKNGDQTPRIDPLEQRQHENIKQQLETAGKMGYVQGVCECAAAVGNDRALGKKLLSEMKVTRGIAQKFAKPGTFKELEKGILAPGPEQKLDQTQPRSKSR